MNQDYIFELSKKTNQEVTVKGWIYNFRSSGPIIFLQLRDGTGFIQIVAERDKISEQVWKACQNIELESLVKVQGKVTKHPKLNEYEIHLNNIELLHVPKQDYPISKKEHGPDFLLDNRHLWLRTKNQWAMLRLRNSIFLGLTDFMQKNHCIRVDSPILTPTSCEDTTELFSVDYFGIPAYLAQSGQLYLEAAEQSVGRCYDFSPAFRAEKSKTRRHLIEFWMMDVELPFFDQDQMEVFQENMVSYVIEYVLQSCQKELYILKTNVDFLKNIKPPFPRITHKEAVDILKSKGFDKEYTQDLTGAEEIMISEMYNKPVIIKDYPFEVKAFYMKKTVDELRIPRAICNDMLFPGYGELIGGSQREDDYEKLLAVIKEKNYNQDDYQWYLDLRRFGSQVHSGFGLGLERFVLCISGRKHIREAIPFPRMLNRLRP
jgi:asparaginyl-tRNA synthetase